VSYLTDSQPHRDISHGINTFVFFGGDEKAKGATNLHSMCTISTWNETKIAIKQSVSDPRTPSLCPPKSPPPTLNRTIFPRFSSRFSSCVRLMTNSCGQLQLQLPRLTFARFSLNPNHFSSIVRWTFRFSSIFTYCKFESLPHFPAHGKKSNRFPWLFLRFYNFHMIWYDILN